MRSDKMTNLELLHTLTERACISLDVDPNDVNACLNLARRINKVDPKDSLRTSVVAERFLKMDWDNLLKLINDIQQSYNLFGPPHMYLHQLCPDGNWVETPDPAINEATTIVKSLFDKYLEWNDCNAITVSLWDDSKVVSIRIMKKTCYFVNVVASNLNPKSKINIMNEITVRG